jgi:hypothetical protein
MVAQLVEQLICNQLVGGSSPSVAHTLISEWVIGICLIIHLKISNSKGGAPESESRARL